MRSIRRNILKRFKNAAKFDITKIISCLAIASTLSLVPVYAQQIQVDGNTVTNLTTNINTTTVTTGTIKGSNAFNSFLKFNVDTGKIVNLVVPDSCSGLINLVHNEASQIKGILNSIQSGKIGGNIFLVNPHGITVGPQGVINVGSLTAVTPTVGYMNSFFDTPGNPNSAALVSLLNGTVPVNSGAQFVNDGTINAIENVKIDTGSMYNSGEIYSGAVFQENDIQLGDVVNLNTLKNGAEIAVNNGEIEISVANDFINSGLMVADGGNDLKAGNIHVTAGNNIELNDGTMISAKGKGENSDGGNIYFFADNDAFFKNGAVIDVRGGEISGDGGFAEFSAANLIDLSGGLFRAKAYDGEMGNILIDPTEIIINGDVNGNQFSDGGNITVTAGGSITVATNVIMSSRDLTDVNTEDHLTALSQGDSGNISLTAPTIWINYNAQIISFANNGYNSGNITIDGSNEINTEHNILKGGDIDFTGNWFEIRNSTHFISDNNVTVDPASYLLFEAQVDAAGTLTLNGGDILNQGVEFLRDSENYINTGSLVSDFLTQDAPFTLVSNNYIGVGNLDNVNIGGNPLNPTSIDITSNFNSISISGAITTPGDVNITTNSNHIYIEDQLNLVSGSNINLNSSDSVSTHSNTRLYAAGNLNISGNNVSINGDNPNLVYLNADGDINIHGNSWSTFEDCNLYSGGSTFITSNNRVYVNNGATFDTTNNLTLDPDEDLYVVGGNFNVGGTFNFYSGDLTTYGLGFYPQSVDANAINSDFITNNADLNIVGADSITVGNFDHFYVGGSPLNLPNIYVQSGGYASLNGDVTVPGNITLEGTGAGVNNSSNIYAGGDLNITGTNWDAYIYSNANVNADGIINLSANSGTAYIYDYANVTGVGGVNLSSTTGRVDLYQYSQVYSNYDLTLTSGSNTNLYEGAVIDVGQDFLINSAGNITANHYQTFNAGRDIIFNANNANVPFGYQSNVTAGRDIIAVANNSHTSVVQESTVNAGNDIIINAPNSYAYIGDHSHFNAGGNIEINGGTIVYVYSDTCLDAYNVTIDAGDFLKFENSSIVADNLLTINSGNIADYGLYFFPSSGTIEAGSLSSDFLQQDAPIDITTSNQIFLANTDHVYIGGAPLNPTYISLESTGNEIYLYGDVSTPGNIDVISTNGSIVSEYSNIYAGGNINIESSGSYAYLLNYVNATAVGDITLTSNNLYAQSHQYVTIDAGGDINFISNNSYANTGFQNTINAGGSLNIFAGGFGSHASIGNYNTVTVDGDINVNSNNLVIIDNYTELNALGSVNVNAPNSDAYIYASTEINAGQDISLTGANNALIENYVTLNAGNDITLSGNYVTTYNNVVLDADHDVSLLPNTRLNVENSSIYADNLLTINSGDLLNNGIKFIPAAATVDAGFLSSDFMAPNSPINITSFSDIYIGNLDHVYVGGNLLNPTSITLNSINNSVYLSGDNTISGDVNLTGGNSAHILHNANINANNINLTSIVNEAYINYDAIVYATGDITLDGNSAAVINSNASVTSDGLITLTSSGTSQTSNNSIVYSADDINIDGSTIYIYGALTSDNNINIAATGTTYINSNYNIDATQDLTVTGNYVVVYNNSTLIGNNVIINPVNRLQFYGSVYATDQLTVNTGNLDLNGVYFVPRQGSVETGTMVSDFLSQPDTDLNIFSTNGQLEIGNLDYVYIGGNQLNPTNIDLSAPNVILRGQNTTPGNITLTSSSGNAYIDSNSVIDAGGYIDITAASYAYIGSSSQVDATGDINIYSQNSTAGIYGSSTVNSDGSIYLKSDLGQTRIDNSANVTAAGDIILDSTITGGDSIVNNYANLTAGNDIMILPGVNHNAYIYPYANLNAGNDILVIANGGSVYAYNDTDFIAGNNIELSANYVSVRNNAFLDAGNNVTLNPVNELYFDNASVNATNQFSIYSGDLANYNFRFIAQPGTIEAGSLDSDFLVQNGIMTINSSQNVSLGNLDYIFIGGTALNPTGLNINANNVYLYGENSISGDINLNATNEATFYDESTTTATGDIFATAPEVYVSGSEVYANNIDLSGDRIYIGDGSYDNYIEATNNITIAPADYLYVDKGSITAGNTLDISGGDILNEGIYFIPSDQSIHTQNLISDFFTANGPINIVSNVDIQFGNLDHIYIGGIPINVTGISLTSNGNSVYLRGDNTVNGNVDLLATYQSNIYQSNLNVTGDVTVQGVNNSGWNYASIQYSNLNVDGNINIISDATSSAYAYILYSTIGVTGDINILAQNGSYTQAYISS
ncbi:MAG: leukotoxin LktA family filamentous adhesin, partial [Cyanobacteriota bacterium]